MTISPLMTGYEQADKTILLVDDNDAIIEFTQEVLEVLGHQVQIAANGCEAINKYIAHKDEIDLVITDLDMPLLNGRDLIAMLHADNPHLKIIVMTGGSLASESPDSPLSQVKLLLSKPFSIDTLVQALITIE